MTQIQTLAGKQIVVAVTGSIAAVEVVKADTFASQVWSSGSAGNESCSVRYNPPGCADVCQWKRDHHAGCPAGSSI